MAPLTLQYSRITCRGRLHYGPRRRPSQPPVLSSQQDNGRGEPEVYTPYRGGEAAGQDFWASKPAWCQPWTIVATGATAIGGSWTLLHTWWITAPLTLVILAWWALFLVLVPLSYAQAVEEERREADR